jgi:ABC-2 type transport system permease protein
LEILLGKLLPYFGLGLSRHVRLHHVGDAAFRPMRGPTSRCSSVVAFLVPSLGQGLLISASTRSQLVASQLAAQTGFLPAFMLSGFLFEIGNMPVWLQTITYIIPARYFVASLQTVFLTGDVWAQFIPNILAMLAIGARFFILVAQYPQRAWTTDMRLGRKSSKRCSSISSTSRRG